VLGDLHEEFLRRARRSLWRARLWYTRQAVAIAITYRLVSMRSRPHRAEARAQDSRERGAVLGGLIFDVRYAIRRLTRDWPFTIPALLVLALGIGANTAVFTIVNRALFRPLQFSDTDRLVNIYQNQGRAAEPVGSSYPAYRDMARYTDVFSGSRPSPGPCPSGTRTTVESDRDASGTRRPTMRRSMG
jgi:hypothetical protein